ncbi:hypothetical protein RJ55_04453 [Drechmeria coniospora]|nr:hypothetical protein RJ55_04453 [Drechmeria coniospora]
MRNDLARRVDEARWIGSVEWQDNGRNPPSYDIVVRYCIGIIVSPPAGSDMENTDRTIGTLTSKLAMASQQFSRIASSHSWHAVLKHCAGFEYKQVLRTFSSAEATQYGVQTGQIDRRFVVSALPSRPTCPSTLSIGSASQSMVTMVMQPQNSTSLSSKSAQISNDARSPRSASCPQRYGEERSKGTADGRTIFVHVRHLCKADVWELFGLANRSNSQGPLAFRFQANKCSMQPARHVDAVCQVLLGLHAATRIRSPLCGNHNIYGSAPFLGGRRLGSAVPQTWPITIDKEQNPWPRSINGTRCGNRT